VPSPRLPEKIVLTPEQLKQLCEEGSSPVFWPKTGVMLNKRKDKRSVKERLIKN
jgi:hypothetical protein